MSTWNDETMVLMHHGILGQKWGVRKYQNPDGTLTEAGKKRYYRVAGTKNGVSIVEEKMRFLGKEKPTGLYDIRVNDKNVGNMIVDDTYGKHKNTVHLNWIGIDNNERRKGYGQIAMDLIIQDAIAKGKKHIVLEAAGWDPAAVHIYEKKGFEAVKYIDDEFWNGLIYMKKDL